MRAIPAFADRDESPTATVVSFAAARIQRAADRMFLSAATIREDAARLAVLADRIAAHGDSAAAGNARLEESHQRLLAEGERARQIADEAGEISALINAGDLSALEQRRNRLVASAVARVSPIG